MSLSNPTKLQYLRQYWPRIEPSGRGKLVVVGIDCIVPIAQLDWFAVQVYPRRFELVRQQGPPFVRQDLNCQIDWQESLVGQDQ